MKSYFLLAAALVLFITTAESQPGSLDMLFGTNGHALADLSAQNSDDENATGVFIQPDGKRVVVVDRYPYIQLIKFNTDGSYDNTFGEGGFSQAANLHHFGGPLSNAAMQTDGKIVAVGETPFNSTTLGDFGVARWNTDGTLDATFGNQGIVQTDIGWSEEALSVKIRPDGKVLVVGETRINSITYLALAQYNNDGTLDGGFGFGGKNVNPNFSQMGLTDMALNPDGTIMVLCDAFGGSSDFVLARFLSTGLIDNSFTTDGYEEYEWSPHSPFIKCMEIQPDAKILLGGSISNGVNSDMLIARYNADGSIDNTFHGDGKNTTHIGGSETIYDLLIQPDGMIVAAGEVYYGNLPTIFALARYEADGDLDGTFAVQGTQITGFSGYEGATATAIALHADGDITAAGGAFNNFTGDVAIATYDLQGPGDQDGYPVQRITAYYADNGVTLFLASAVQTDGKLVAVGRAWNGRDFDFAIARFNTDGTPDPSFGNGGYVLTQFPELQGSGDEGALAVAIQSDGKIVATGSWFGFAVGGSMPVARYNPDGSLDDSFDSDGRKLIDYTGAFEEGNAVLIQPNGKILIGGSTNIADFDFALCRLLPADGALDPDFGGGTGMVFTDFGYQDIIFGLALRPDGKFLATGNTSLPNSFDGFDFCTVLYNSDGTVDLGFGTNGDGRTTTDFDGGIDFATSIALQSDGKIVVGGGAPVNNDFEFALARYNSDGTPDMLFGNSGTQTTAFNGYDIGDAVSIQNDGKAILAGFTQGIGGSHPPVDFALARYSTGGILDGCFGIVGKVISDFKGAESALAIGLSDNRIYATGYRSIFREFTATDKFFGIVAAYSGNPTLNIVNGDFESGISPWSFYTDGTGSLTPFSPGAGGSGNAARVTVTTTGTNTQLFQGGIPLKPATDYRLSFKAYSSNGKDFSAFVQRHDAPYTNYGLNGTLFNLTTGWQTYTVDFTTVNFPPPIPSNARLRFKLNGYAINNTVYYIDDVRLEEISCNSPEMIRVETAANGSGGVVPDQTIQTGNSISAYSITRTAALLFAENVAATWSLEDITGGVGPGDLVPEPDGKSAVFTGNTAGSARIRASVGGLAETWSGVITVNNPPPATNLLINGGFEGGTAPWAFNTNGAGSYTTVSPGIVGAKAAQVSITSNGTATQLSQTGVQLIAGNTYRLSIRALSSTGHDISLIVHQNSSPYAPYGLNSVCDLTSSWQTFTRDFVATGFGGTTTDTRVRIWLGPFDATGDIYRFDDMSLTQLPAPPGPELYNVQSRTPNTFALEQNYPNPFNPSTSIKFDIPQVSQVMLQVFDILGRQVATLVNEQKTPGRYEVEWNTQEAASGVYLYRIEAGNYVETRKMILMR